MLKRLTTASILALTVLSSPVFAQDEVTADTVVATVNGHQITIGHMILARDSLPEQFKQLPDDVLFSGILDQLVQQAALSQKYDGPVTRRMKLTMENEEMALRAGTMIDRFIREGVTDDAIQAAYDAKFKDADFGLEYSAQHILVETEEAAKALIDELNGGKDFGELAKEKSTGPSGPNGGELGWFGEGMMVPEFEDAVKAMKAGDVSAPVKTQFGWHVIKLNETRKKEAPTLEEAREELIAGLQQDLVKQKIEEFAASADVKRENVDALDKSVLKNLDLLEN